MKKLIAILAAALVAAAICGLTGSGASKAAAQAQEKAPIGYCYLPKLELSGVCSRLEFTRAI